MDKNIIGASIEIPVVSFCISTFNRAEKIFSLVTEILNYSGIDIEVVVLDNCSNDNTRFELSKIKDARFHYLDNSTNIGAIQNYIRVMSAGKGQYIFFSTDKDSIKASGINDLVDYLRNSPSTIAGYCSLDILKRKPDEVLEQGFKSLKRIGYLSRHPTGYFFQNKVLHELQITEKFSDINQVGSFPFEFILAEFCMRGKTAIINIPLCYMESMEDVKNIKSYSYSGTDNNLYFSPSQRYKMFERYVNHLQTLDISNKEKKIIVKNLFSYGLACSTIGYKSILQNKIICDHYNIATRKISLFESIRTGYNFSNNFITTCNYSDIRNRFIICLETHIEYMLRKFKIKFFQKKSVKQ